MAVIFAVLVTFMLVELTNHIFPAQHADPLPPPGSYSTQGPILSSQDYALFLTVSFVIAVGATAAIMLLMKWGKQKKLKMNSLV